MPEIDLTQPQELAHNTENEYEDYGANWDSDDPNDRFCAALRGENAQMLQDDDCWLVRHAAKRTLLRMEMERKGLFSQKVYANEHYPFSGISDIAYELYRMDWINKNTTTYSRTQFVHDWVVECVLLQRQGKHPQSFDNWVFENLAGGNLFLTYDEFCGFLQPGCKGLYHDREYISHLFDNSETLLAMYDADINDGHVGQFKSLDIDSMLKEARGKSYSNNRCADLTEEEYGLEQ